MTTNDIDARTIAADIMTINARSISYAEIWAHIGQAYDTAEVDASVVTEAMTLIAEAGIDLIWPDGSKNTELDAARVEIERLRAEWDRLVDERAAMLGVVRAAEALAEFRASLSANFGGVGDDLVAAVDALPNTQEPCGICAGNGCPDCRDDLSGVEP